MINYRLTRLGVIMAPQDGDPLEAEGVLNPGSGTAEDGTLYLFPRLVAEGNISRVGKARVLLEDGVPTGVQREGVVLEPDCGWERGAPKAATANAGTEDPRITRIDALDLWVMTYVAYGPLGPRTALAVSRDLASWERLGPVLFGYQADLDMDLNLFSNKDCLFFPEPVPAPDGTESIAMLHRPMWDLNWFAPGRGVPLPAQANGDDRPGIWISYVPLEDVQRDLRRLVLLGQHRLVAMSEHAWEELKIGGGPPPLRVDEGWLLLHHGVSGILRVEDGDQQSGVNYAAGAMILDAADPSRVLERTPEPLLQAETRDELDGIVPNVVFPTAIEQVDGRYFVFYGMADSKIGVAELTGPGLPR